MIASSNNPHVTFNFEKCLVSFTFRLFSRCLLCVSCASAFSWAFLRDVLPLFASCSVAIFQSVLYSFKRIQTTNVIDFLDGFYKICIVNIFITVKWSSSKDAPSFCEQRKRERVKETWRQMSHIKKKQQKSIELIKSNDCAVEFQVYFSSLSVQMSFSFAFGFVENTAVAIHFFVVGWFIYFYFLLFCWLGWFAAMAVDCGGKLSLFVSIL